MRGSYSISFAYVVLAAWLTRILAAVTVLQTTQTIYDRSPKLRIRGTGFDADDHDIYLELGAENQPLKVNKDYLITKDPDGDGLILKLIGNRKWVDLEETFPPVALLLNAIRFGSDTSTNLLVQPVLVAQVLETPSVLEGYAVIYSSVTNELRINGTGFMGAKKVDLYFQPPLYKEIAYEDVTKYPLQRNQVVLRLRHNYNWREDEGPLLVVGVDTGGGPVKLNGDEGVKVADVVEDLDVHDVTVFDTSEDQLIYHDQSTITISGSGFNPIGNNLRFANGILGNNVNYTTQTTNPTSLILRLTAGSYWRKNADNLPGALTLLAVNTGGGYVNVGPINSQKGVDVAMVFERPNVFSSNIRLFRTHTHEVHVKGAGFPYANSGYKPLLKFKPDLVADVDYTVRVIDRTEMELTLLDGRAWRPDAGGLQIVAINTRGDDAGWVTFGGDGVHVAQIDEDVDADTTGGVEVFPMGVKVYQSALNQKIQITGTGFKEGMSFVFEPELKTSDYTMDVNSANQIVLALKPGKKWREDPGFIIAKSVKIGGKTYDFAKGEGIRVAVVLADPVISPSKDSYHESQSKLVVISGSGFTNVADTKIMIRPSSPGAYKILGVLEDAIRVQLKPDQDWLPSWLSLKDAEDGKKVAMQVASIDTGAGDVTFPDPITVGYIIKDREGVTCDDSCEFAFDGVCDDGSEPFDYYYYQNYNNYMDDDLGGFYGEPEDWDGDGVAYGIFYDDYYMENEDYVVSACVEGTDCTDCGGVDAIIDYSKPLDPDSGYESCTNTCIYPRDGVCDDPRGTKYCELGTDCQDCGPVGADNFTRSDDDGWWDDDDDYWNFNDGNFLDQAGGLENNRDKVKTYNADEVVEPAAMFLVILEGMVYTVGAIFAAAVLYLLHRWYKGQSIPFLQEFDPERASERARRDFEMAPTKKMPLTPDVIRT